MVEFIIDFHPENLHNSKNCVFSQQDVVVSQNKKTITAPILSGISKCINEYLQSDELASLLREDAGINTRNKVYKFRLVFHGAQDLYAGDWNALQNTMTKSYWQQSEDNMSDDYKIHGQLPIIHLSTYNIFEHEFDNLPTKRYKKIIDSSIWNYYVPLDVKDVDKDGKVIINHDGRTRWKYDDNYGLFVEALKSIIHNTDAHLYNLVIAHEYADLNARLLEQSYLNGDHKAVSPFLFHSEYDMKASLKKEYKKNVNDEQTNLIKKYKWRFLLLDDKIDKSKPEGILKSLKEANQITKCDIIEYCIKSIFADSFSPASGLTCKTFIYDNAVNDELFLKEEDADIVIVCVNNVSDAQNMLKKHKFDIILVDYLLGKVKKDGKEKQEYGYMLLKDIHDLCRDEKDKVAVIKANGYFIGPQESFFFMFISAFTTAISEKLNDLGLSRNEEIWEIGEGACPTNTPELFKYRLVHLMKRRLVQTGIANLTYENIINLLECIFHKDSDRRIKFVRQRAYNKYKDILGLHYDYFALKKDEDKSRLVESFMKNQVNMDALLEHLLQFVHLVAFGTVRQWPEIWEEYKSVFRVLNNAPMKSDLKKRVIAAAALIENYIVTLKSA